GAPRARPRAGQHRAARVPAPQGLRGARARRRDRTVRRFAAGAAIALLGAACTAPRPELPVAPAPMETRVAQILADARPAEHEGAAAVRNQLAEDAGRQADACLAAAPQAGPCLYGRAIALGLETRAHPVHANESLKRMLADLEAAEAADPGYDEAGPARVRAL